MTEQEYLSRLERALKDAPEDDRNEALAFYHGYFEAVSYTHLTLPTIA